MKKLFTLVMLVSAVFSGFSQNTFFKELRQFTYVGNIVETSDSGFLIPGTTFINDGWVSGLIKLDSRGDSLWMKYFDLGCSSPTSPPVIAVNNEGDIFMAGNKLRKLNSEGDSLWTMDLAPNGWNEAVLPLPDGGVIAAGSLSEISKKSSPAVIRADKDGNQIFRKEFFNFQGLCTTVATDICTLNNDNFLVMYRAYPCVTYGYTYYSYFIETNSDGDSVRNYLFKKYESQILESVLKTEDGLLFSGGRTDTPYSQYKSYIIKTNNDYSTIWDTTYYESDTLEWIMSSCFSENPEWIYHVGTNYRDNIVLLNVNAADGAVRWKREFCPGYEASPGGIISTMDGGIAISGYAPGYEPHGLIIKLNNAGNFNGIADEKISSEFKIEPNPSTGTAKLKWKSSGDYTLIISNSTGSVVRTINSKSIPGDNIILPLDLSGYASGIYFCRLITGRSETVKKMLVY